MSEKSGWNKWKTAEQRPTRRRWYDLCVLECVGGKKFRVWWDGCRWDGINYAGQEIIRWKHYNLCQDQGYL